MLLCLCGFWVKGEGWGCRFRFEVIMSEWTKAPSIVPEDTHTTVEGWMGRLQEPYRILTFLCSSREAETK